MMKPLFSFEKFAIHMLLAGIGMTVQAADVTSYGVLKGQKFFQFSPSPPIAGLGTML